MNDFVVKEKLFIKSKNDTSKMIYRYTYSLIAFTILTIILDICFNHHVLTIPLLKSTSISLISAIIIDYILNIIIKKDKHFFKIFNANHVEVIALIIGLFSINVKSYIIVLAVLISLIIKHSYRGMNTTASLYGVLVILLYQYLTNDLVTPLNHFKELAYTGGFSEIVTDNYNIINYLIGSYYLSPVLSVLAFIYLFVKKSIKYPIVIAYLLTFGIIMLAYGVLNGMHIWLVFFELITGSIIFLSVYTLPDYRITPTIMESSIIYGIILAVLTSILRFIIPELSVIIPLLIGPLLLTKPLERASAKLKYNKKVYTLSMIGSVLLVLITIIGLTIKF